MRRTFVVERYAMFYIYYDGYIQILYCKYCIMKFDIDRNLISIVYYY